MGNVDSILPGVQHGQVALSGLEVGMSHFDITWDTQEEYAALKKENCDLRLLIAVLLQANSELKAVITHAARKLGEVKRG